jgi:hypothetical protein
MLTGSHFVLVGVDTLRGTVKKFSDVIAVDRNGKLLPEPPARRLLAVKTTCPR